jgi:hypothetical protein
MAKLVFGMNVSLDGYVDHDAFAPGVALFQHFIEQTRELSGSVYGRGLYEVAAPAEMGGVAFAEIGGPERDACRR